MIQQIDPQQTAKAAGDIGAITIAGATLMEWLPPLAAAASILWIVLQIFMHWEKIRDAWRACVISRKASKRKS